MTFQVPPVVFDEPELHLLTEWQDVDRGRRASWAALGAIVVHIGFYFSAVAINEYLPLPEIRRSQSVDVRKSIPLILPPSLLTQREPNRSKVAKLLKLENLVASPNVHPTPKVSSNPPAAPVGRPAPPVPVPVLEPPQVKIAEAPPPLPGVAPNLPGPPTVKPPPQIQAEEKPKLSFETPGVATAKPGGMSRIEAPKTGIQEAIRGAARPGAGGISVGDTGVDQQITPGIGQVPGQPGSSPRQASSLDLLSDPMGVDFKPYLTRVLAAVRKNWFSVIPESARFGRRGKVVLQFSIDRAGAVPKLVIVMPSGTEAFDRAAVAGISASNPFPPLPADFRGDQIRLQLAFFYNVPSR
jgi:TonB family protein